MKILGIETSCDECAAAVVEDGRKILSNIVATQIPFHAPYSGVVPEIASRKHTEWIYNVVKEALDKADIEPGDIDAVAVTNRPGLLGSPRRRGHRSYGPKRRQRSLPLSHAEFT